MQEQVIRNPNTGRFSTVQVNKTETVEVKETPGVGLALFILAGVILVIAISYNASVPLALVGAVYVIWKHWRTLWPVSETQAVTERPKRRWQKRIKFRDFQTGKTVRI